MKIDYRKPVKVYRNLKHGRTARPLYSVMQNGKVIKRVHRLLLEVCEFRVNEAGRQRVIKDKRKNVHAFVVGRITQSAYGSDKNSKDLPAKITYNPYNSGNFMYEDRPITVACAVLLNENGISACYVN